MLSRITRLAVAMLLLAWMVPSAATALDADDDGTPAGFENYVALGDSYTAGPLIPLQTPGPLGCFRSSDNYPAFLANYLDVQTFTDVSCSAARSENLDEPQTGNLPAGLPLNENAPQKFALTPETDLVTLGIGGNDFGLFGGLIDNCARLAEEQPEAEAPCKDFFTVDGVDTKIADARAIRANIEEALDTIQERSPDARVVVVNYLHILPETGTCEDVPFAEGDYRWGTTVQLELNDSLRGAAELKGADYVDTYAASVGRDACAGLGRWVNGANISPVALNFHPFRSGMKAIADETFTQLTGEQAPAISLPVLELRKRVPALLDVEGLLDYIAGGGFVPPEVVEDLDPEEPANPNEPVDPTDPSDPSDPTDPTDPAGPDTDIDRADDAAPAAGSSAGGGEPTSVSISAPDWMPDAGGPSLALLAAGLGLVGTGAWLARRRTTDL